jgi:putative oxidoreductase
VQRLYSTFPTGKPGVGLLLLRLAAGCSLIVERIQMMLPMPPSPLWEINIALILIGICICLGLWTPIMAGLEAIGELLMTVTDPGHYESHLLLTILGISLAMLGPGAWSIDGLIFGRKRITV